MAEYGETRTKNGMDDLELGKIIHAQEAAAYAFSQSELANDRAKALDYYLGKPFGNEVEGRSQVVSTDVFDTVEGMLPSLLEIFTSSNKIAEFEPFGPEDEAEAKQQTEVANHILFKQNNAELIFYIWFKDALLSKNGVVKFYYEDQKNEFRTEHYENLTQEELNTLGSQEHVEVKRATKKELMIGPQPVVVYDVEVKVYTKRGRVKVCNVPPENFYVTARQSSIDISECEFCSHKEQKTITDLLEMGFSEEDVQDITDSGDLAEMSSENISRSLYASQNAEQVSDHDASMRSVWCSDVYLLIDYDGDGVAELRHVFMAGNKVLSNEEADHIPFAVISPVIFPHQFYGISAADMTMDIQLYKSAIIRQMMDSLYLANNPRNAVLDGMVEMDDLLTSRPGGIVRVRAQNAITPLLTPFVAKESFPMVEYWESVKENRTGVTRYNQGLDADSLNKTAHGISQIMTAAMKRQELIARLFAATGVKQLVRGIMHCVASSGMKALTVRLTNGYVNIDPRNWKNQYDATINVALGSGTKDRQLQMLGMIAAKQVEMIQLGRGYMVSEQNQYNLATKQAEAAGFKNPELFFTDPKSVPEQAKVPPPNPDMVKLETDTKLKVADMRTTTQQKDKDMANDRAIEEMKAKVAYESDIRVAMIQKEAQENVARIRAETDARLKAAELMNSDEDRKQGAELEVFKANKELVPEIAANNLESSRAMVGALEQVVSQLAAVGQNIVQSVQAVLDAKKVTSTAVKKDKAGKLVGTVKTYADGSTEEIPHKTIQ